jgi:hypothetical protein
MTICNWVLTPIVILVKTLIQVVREIVRTVCEWVSTIVTTIVEVARKVCSWLPWPLNKVCNWVTDLVEVVETVWSWVCHEVIDRIIEWIEILVEYIIYVLRWVCWVIDWILRAIDLLLCKLGFRGLRCIRVCVKILTDAQGTPAVSVADATAMMRDAAAIFARCNMRVVIAGTELVRKEEFLDGTTCDFGGMFSAFWVWFSDRACACCSAVTVYFVRSIVDASGCAYPGTNWVTVAANGGDGTTVVQEIGHLADLWQHSSDPNNVMTDQPGGTHDQITPGQCCMIRTSRFATSDCSFDIGRLARELIERIAVEPGRPFERKPRGDKRSAAWQRRTPK